MTLLPTFQDTRLIPDSTSYVGTCTINSNGCKQQFSIEETASVHINWRRHLNKFRTNCISTESALIQEPTMRK